MIADYDLEEDLKELLKNDLMNLVSYVENGNTAYTSDILINILEWCGYYANGCYTMWTDTCEDKVLSYIKEEGFEYLQSLVENYGNNILKSPHRLEFIFLENKYYEIFREIFEDDEEIKTIPEALIAIEKINDFFDLGLSYKGEAA